MITDPPPSAFRRHLLLIVGATVCVFGIVPLGCVDFGYRVDDADSFADAATDAPPPSDAAPLDAAPADSGGVLDAADVDAAESDAEVDAAPACVEGPTAPSDTGPQLQFIPTLNVDQPMFTISAGDVVTWTNTDSMRHTATAGAPGAIVPMDRGGFISGDIATGARWAYRFCDPRTLVWFCETHPAQMNGYRIVIGP